MNSKRTRLAALLLSLCAFVAAVAMVTRPKTAYADAEGTVVVIAKLDSETTEPLDGATFCLINLNDNSERIDTTHDGGGIVFIGVSDGEYILIEQKPPEGYDAIFTEVHIVIQDGEITRVEAEGIDLRCQYYSFEEVMGSEPPEDSELYGYLGYWVIPVFNARSVPEPPEPEPYKATMSIEGEKTWDDAEDKDGKRPESITVHVLADGAELGSVALSEANGWKFTLYGFDASGAPVLDANTEPATPLYLYGGDHTYGDNPEITYTLEEDPVDGYTATIEEVEPQAPDSGSGADSGEELDNDKIEELDSWYITFSITNKYTPEEPKPEEPKPEDPKPEDPTPQTEPEKPTPQPEPQKTVTPSSTPSTGDATVMGELVAAVAAAVLSAGTFLRKKNEG